MSRAVGRAPVDLTPLPAWAPTLAAELAEAWLFTELSEAKAELALLEAMLSRSSPGIVA